MAPAPTPNISAARLGLNAEAPIQAPSTAGRAGEEPEQREAAQPRAARSCATGATIASPSVVLWSAKPTTSVAPSASEPTAYAEPIASPSPRLCRPMPSATRKAAR